MKRFVASRATLATLTTAGLLVVSSTAMASGFSAARLGGIHGNATSATPASIYYNPANMARVQGTQILADLTLVLRNASYERTGNADADAVAVNTGKNTLFNLINSPAAAITTDFGGRSKNFVLGAGFYAPFGGQAVWDDVDVPAGYEVAGNGTQRWFAIDGIIRQLTGTLGGAVRTNDGQFSVGMTLNLNIFQIDTIRARNGDGSDTVLNSSGGVQEGRSWLDVSSIDPSIGLGFTYESLDGHWTVGASYQSASNMTGNIVMDGTLTNQFGPGSPESADVRVLQQVPGTARLGVAYRFYDRATVDTENPIVRGELRLGGELTSWGQFKSQCIVNEAQLGDANIQDVCRYLENGMTSSDPAIIQNLVRGWKHGWGVKLSGSYYLNPRIELAAGLGFDANAIPDRALDPALMDMNKIAVDLGGRFQVARWLAINAMVTNVFYFERDTTGVPTYESFIPDGEPGNRQNLQPSSAGIYNQNMFIVNLGLNFMF